MPRFNLIFMLTIISCLIVGCQAKEPTAIEPEVPEAGEAVDPESGEPEPAPTGQTEEEDPATTQSDSQLDQPVSLEILSWDETAALIGQEKGKVVVLDLWSTSCPPCLAELPNLVQLAKEHPDDVSCISVSLDYAGFEDEPVESYEQDVFTWLLRFDARIKNVLCSTDFNSIFGTKIRHASLPVVFVYDQSGQLAGYFPDPEDPAEFTYQADVTPLVTKLLQK